METLEDETVQQSCHILGEWAPSTAHASQGFSLPEVSSAPPQPSSFSPASAHRPNLVQGESLNPPPPEIVRYQLHARDADRALTAKLGPSAGDDRPRSSRGMVGLLGGDGRSFSPKKRTANREDSRSPQADVSSPQLSADGAAEAEEEVQEIGEHSLPPSPAAIDDDPNIPSPAESPTRSPPGPTPRAAPSASARSTPSKGYRPVTTLSPASIRTGRQLRSPGLRTLRQHSPTANGLSLRSPSRLPQAPTKIVESQDSFADQPLLTIKSPFERVSAILDIAGQAVMEAHSVMKEDGADAQDGIVNGQQDSVESEQLEGRAYKGSVLHPEDDAPSSQPVALGASLDQYGPPRASMTFPFGFPADQSSLNRVSPPNRPSRFAGLAQEDTQSSPTRFSHLFSSQATGLGFTQEESQRSILFTATQSQARLKEASPESIAERRSPIEEPTQLNESSGSDRHAHHDNNSQVSSLQAGSSVASAAPPLSHRVFRADEATQSLERVGNSRGQPQPQIGTAHASVAAIVQVRQDTQKAKTEATQMLSDESQRRALKSRHTRNIPTQTPSLALSSNGTTPPVSDSRKLSRRKPPALGMTGGGGTPTSMALPVLFTADACVAVEKPAERPVITDQVVAEQPTVGFHLETFIDLQPVVPSSSQAEEDRDNMDVDTSFDHHNPTSPKRSSLLAFLPPLCKTGRRSGSRRISNNEVGPEKSSPPVVPVGGAPVYEPTLIDLQTLPLAPPPHLSPNKSHGESKARKPISGAAAEQTAESASDGGEENDEAQQAMDTVTALAGVAVQQEMERARRMSHREKRKSARAISAERAFQPSTPKRPRKNVEGPAVSTRPAITPKSSRVQRRAVFLSSPPPKEGSRRDENSEPETPPDPENHDFDSYRPSAFKAKLPTSARPSAEPRSKRGSTAEDATTTKPSNRQAGKTAAVVTALPRPSRRLTDNTDSSALTTASAASEPAANLLVLAFWPPNKAYFPGCVTERTNQEYEVRFLDKTVRTVVLQELRLCSFRVGDVVWSGLKKFKWELRVEKVKLNAIEVSRGGKALGALKLKSVFVPENIIERDYEDRRVTAAMLRLPVNSPYAATSQSRLIAAAAPSPTKSRTRIFARKIFLVTSAAGTRHAEVDKLIEDHGGLIKSSWQAIFDLPPDGFGSRLKTDSNRTPFVIFVGTPDKMMPKLMVALAKGIPCLSSRYVEDAVQTHVDWRSYLISPGKSEYLGQECSQLVDSGWGEEGWDAAKARNPRQPFKGKAFLFRQPREKRYEELKMLVPFCLHALGAASCRAVDKNDRTGIDTDFILFEDRENPPAIPFEMRNDPRTVSTAWLKQCLLMGAALPPRLSYDD